MKALLGFLLLLLMVVPLAVSAQATTQTLTLDSDYTITVPSDWKMTKNDDGSYTLAGSNLAVAVTTPVRLHAMSVNFTSKTGIVDVENALVTLFDGVQLDNSDIQKTFFGAREAAVYTYTDNNTSDQFEVALKLSDGSFGYLSFSVVKGQLSSLRTEINVIASSFDSTKPAATEETGTSGETGSVAVTCTVSTDKANSAQLRVGPGKNRGAIAFLPANTDVTVTGRIQLDDGSVWYQLDKSEAAPKGTAASQLWVSADVVNVSGDCDQVGDTAAPPVIPGVVAPPTAAPGGGSNSGGATSASASPGALPNSGGWVLVLDQTTNASCLGTQNFPVPTSQLFTPTTYGDTIVIKDAGSFYYSSDTFTRIPGTNSFEGTFTYSDGSIAQVRFDLISANQMTGHITANYTLQGHQCSETVNFVSNHG